MPIRPRVMVSSVVWGFEAERDAARAGIIAAGGEPVLVNEDFPAIPETPRTVCLDAVASSDIYLCIVGERGGFRAPSGKTVVQEEFEEAKRRKLSVLVFVKSGEHDAEAAALLKVLEDYVGGRFRREFNSPEELQRQVSEALGALLAPMRMPETDPGELKAEMLATRDEAEGPYLKVVLAPERREEVIDPRQLGRGDLGHRILEMGHSQAVGLFSFGHATDSDLRGDCLKIRKRGAGHNPSDITVVKIRENGWLSVSAHLNSPSSGHSTDFTSMFVLAEENIEDAFRRILRFSTAFYDLIDEHQRYSSLLMMVGLGDLGYRSIERNPVPRSGGIMRGMGASEDLILADARLRRVTRQILAHPDDEVDRTLYKLVAEVNGAS